MRADELTADTVLILAPTFNDSNIAVDVLGDAGVKAVPCKNLNELCEHLHDCGAAIIAEEAIGYGEKSMLQSSLDLQAPWSDVPIILLTSNDIDRATELFSQSGNISLLEKPFSKLTLVRSVQSALRARRKQYEVRDLLTALKKSKDEAEKANTLKTQFLANMSHEIRTPIGAILGFTDLLKNPFNSIEENYTYMGIVERNSTQLLRLIDDILDLSKVEAGKMTVENIRFSMAELLTDFISVMAFKASEKGISFRFNLDTQIPDFVSSDPVRIRQILTNVVGNALKFTDKGYVAMNLSYSNSKLIFIVKDTGVGVSEVQATRLFQPFSQADTSTTRKYGGTGLGLVLSKRLAENLGGTLELIESKADLGSTFKVEIFAPRQPDTKLISAEALAYSVTTLASHQNSRALQGLKVLVVEDSHDNQMLISTYLKKEGAHVSLASNGQQGIDAAMTEDFDILLMDIQMPVLDGYGATKNLRSLNYKKPIIALTAHAMKEERIRCLESGFTEFLTKPVQRDVLIKVVSVFAKTVL
jgi:signal transduction histidine kinase